MNDDDITISPDKKSMMANIINLMALAYLDGTVTDEEKHLISDIAHSYGLNKEEFEYCADIAEQNIKEGKATIEVPEDEDSKVAFLKNLVMTMMCDGNIDKNERDFVEFITDRFGFKAKETVDYLINSITEEFVDKTGDNTANAVALGKEALGCHDIMTAFDNLVNPAHLDRNALALFLRIPDNEHWIRLLSEEQVDLLKEYAEKGYAASQFALGRYYQVVEASYDKARDLFIAASKAGLADASAALAIMYRRGQLGEISIDKEKYLQFLKEACEKGSVLGNYQLFKAEVFGLDGVEACPQDIIDSIKKWLNGDESEDIQKVDPMYYEILALSYQALDNWETAADYYMKCIQTGRIETLPDYLILTSYNHDYELVDEEGYNKGIELGCENGIPYCFLMRAASNKDRYNDTEDETEKAKLHKLIAEDLTTASLGGDGDASVQLGNHYYYGDYGFEEDNDLAWGHFLDATGMNTAEGWSMLAQMVLDGNGPENLPGGFVTYCRLMALRLGDNDQLIPVILAYRSGALGKYKEEIEKYYQPQYEALPDEEKVTYFGMSFIAVIKPSGKADIIEFDLNAEDMDELAQIIDAKALKAIRSEKLDQLSEELEIDGGIVTWIDSDGTNEYAILTMANEEHQPQSFDDIYQLEEILTNLDCEVEKIYYDDFPDNDSHNDPYA